LQAAFFPVETADAAVPIFAALLATYSLGAHGNRRAVMLGAPQPILLILVVDLTQPKGEPLTSALPFFAFFVVGAPLLAGRLVRSRTALVTRLREQRDQLEASRTAQLDAALAEERARLASEFHATLIAGMENLAGRIDTALPDRQAMISGLEEAARDLLARTRHAVVSLASATPALPEPGDRVAFRPALRSARKEVAQPWTVMAGAALCAGLLTEMRSLPLRVPAVVAVFACLVIALVLAMAWVRPLPMTAALWAAVASFAAFIAPLNDSFTAIGLSFVPPFAIAALESRGRALAGFGVCCVGELATFGPKPLASNVTLMFFCWLAGAVFYERWRLVDELRRNNVLLEEQQRAAARAVVYEERANVARELHDAVGHSLTVVALQAGAARRLWSTEPLRSAAALETIQQVIHAGLAELRLGIPRTDDSASGELTISANVNDLIESARRVGIPVQARLDDIDAVTSVDVRHTVYRVVQESLTNVLKHATGATAEVTIRNCGVHVDVVVSNTSAGPKPGTSGQSRGLRGMRQRVEACGGQLTWAHGPDGGFTVRARLPISLADA
jgi:signal transduction histidine kinase